MDEQIEKGIFHDFSRSLTLGHMWGTGVELERIASNPQIKKIQAELGEVFEKRDQPNHGFNSELGVINSPFDSGLRGKIEETIADIHNKGIDIQYVVLAGIGGSELGATAMISACGNRNKKYYPITSMNSDSITEIQSQIEPDKTVLVCVTRSGTTKETLTVYSVFKKYLEDSLGQRHLDHCVAILGKDKKELAGTMASHDKIGIEGKMSGRFTVFHAANLFTMALMDVDIDKFHSGARYMAEKSLQAENPEENTSLYVGWLKYLMNNCYNLSVLNTAVFSPRLLNYGHWLDQLTEESLGHKLRISLCTKTTDLSNKLHSDFQNWYSGNNIFYHQFVFPLNSEEKPIENPLARGETLEDIEFAAYLAAADSLSSRYRPSFTTFLHSINPIAMGQLMMRDLLATIYMGELYNLKEEPGVTGKGYLNQPGVQAYKDIMNTRLGNLDDLRQERKAVAELKYQK